MVMIYMLDTDIMIFILRGVKAPPRQRARRDKALAIVDRCRQSQANGDTIAVSAITVSELEFGAHNSADYDTEIAAVRKLLAPFQAIDYDGVHCPQQYGRVRHELEQLGQAIGAMDLLIAAHAVAASATLVTNNISHFRRITGLTVEQWP